ncbi:hypothetical protein M2140_000104 [Clostridiales Family XIII bacterium PM5-7]
MERKSLPEEVCGITECATQITQAELQKLNTIYIGTDYDFNGRDLYMDKETYEMYTI